MKRVAVITAALALTATPSALAFDTAPHYDITGDALTAEGFGRDAVRLAQANNWFVDLYVNAKATPQSGHAPWWKTLLGARWYLGEIENWNSGTVNAATRMHFDSHQGGWGYRQKQDLEHEWKRLLEMTIRHLQGGSPDREAGLLPDGARRRLPPTPGLLHPLELGRAALRHAARLRRAGLGRPGPRHRADVVRPARRPARPDEVTRLHERQRKADRLQGPPLEPRPRQLALRCEQAPRDGNEQGLARA